MLVCACVFLRACGCVRVRVDVFVWLVHLFGTYALALCLHLVCALFSLFRPFQLNLIFLLFILLSACAPQLECVHVVL